jgi:predicted glycogen debranching enzyme
MGPLSFNHEQLQVLRHVWEWVEADGVGGFASGTISGLRTSRCHALLLAATPPSPHRYVLVNGMDAWIQTAGASVIVTPQHYTPDVRVADQPERLESFALDPWPSWKFRVDDGVFLEQELFVPHGRAVTALRWRLSGSTAGDAVLRVRPFLSGRDMQGLHRENKEFNFEPERGEDAVIWHPYRGIPAVITRHNGRYRHEPYWYRNFVYDQDRAQGLEAVEDLAAPGFFEWDLEKGEAIMLLCAEGFDGGTGRDARPCAGLFSEFEKAERLRRA